MLELPLPWTYNTLESPYVPPGFGELVQGLYARQIYPGLVGFAPDEAYSVHGMTRVIDYALPNAPFSGFAQREYLIPTAQVSDVLRDSLAGGSSDTLDTFAVQVPAGQRDILVYTHGAIDACCATYGYPMYKLPRHMADNPAYRLRVWRCTHFGGHRFAATLLDMPQGRYWGRLSAQDLGPIVRRDGEVELMRKRYRGWAARPYGGAQVAEGEAFLRARWDWLDCLVTPGDAPPHDFDHGPPRSNECRSPSSTPGAASTVQLSLGSSPMARSGPGSHQRATIGWKQPSSPPGSCRKRTPQDFSAPKQVA